MTPRKQRFEAAHAWVLQHHAATFIALAGFCDALASSFRQRAVLTPMSPRAKRDLAAGLECARRDIASGRPLTPWRDFTKYAIEDDEYK